MLLKLGSTGDNVKILQLKLKLTADGLFGPNTEEKVKEYQIKNGFVVNGIIDDIIWNKIVVSDLKLEKLKGVIPNNVLVELTTIIVKFNINTSLRLSHFLSQCSHESGEFKIVSENLNYSADGLLKIFPNYFNKDTVNEYARNPEKIGDKVYGQRMSNNGHGYEHRGFGYLQITGAENQNEFSEFIDDENIKTNPKLIADKYPLTSACWFFTKNNLFKICDEGFDEITITKLTKRINGGVNGLSDRIKQFNKFWNLLK